MQKNKIVVFDFDETILKKNSFTIWCRWLVKYYFFNFRVLLFLNLVYLILQRKVFRRLEHEEFKLKLIKSVPKDINNEFSKYLLNREWNLNVCNKLLECKRNGYFVVISSAAPLAYLLPTVKLKELNADLVLGAELSNDGILISNFKEDKALNVLKRLNVDRIDLFFTDSLDDMAMMKISGEIFIVLNKNNTESKFRYELKLNKIVNFKFIGG
ncbi:HAD family hydrolase [Vibrio cyclitrophicus]